MTETGSYTGNEKTYLMEAIESGILSSYDGEMTMRCEKAFEEILGGGVRAVICII